MPERQSSPGEVTERPETDGSTNGSTDGKETTVTPASSGEPVGDQVADQVAAEPEAVEPAPVEPGDAAAAKSSPAGDQPVMTAERAVDIADDGSAAPADPSGATTVPAPHPRPRPAPDADDTVRTPAAPPATAAAATPRPSTEEPTRPTQRPAADGPTVAVPLPAAAPAAPPAAPPRDWDSEATQVIPLGQSAPADPPTERLPLTAAGPPPTPPQGTEAGPAERRRRRGRPLLIVAAVVAVLALVYVGDLLLSNGSVPRGVTVAGVPVGGLGLADAEQRLRAEIEPRTTQPVQVTVGEVSSQIDPTTAGLAVDWTGTLDRAGEQPLNPITRITSLFTSRELGVATTVDRDAVGAALGELGPIVDRLPAEGTVRFEGATPVPVDPIPGQQLDQPAAIGVLERDWASGVPVALPLITLDALTTPDDVATAIDDVATPAVSAPVTVIGEGDTRGTLEPETIAAALTFEPGPEGGLNPVLNPTVVTDALTPQLAGSERAAVDAELNFATNPPSVVPSQDGRGVDYDATLADLLPALTGTGPREITAVYADQPAELTTEEVQSLGTATVIGEFTTTGFARDSGQNIRRAAELVNGTIVQPGETFSLDAVTGPRTAANGYIEAGVIDDGRPGRGIAGGVSQVSTTLYNAGYLAGMTDIEHTPHSFYISRYPAGREATIATGAIDNRFRNDNPTAVLIQTEWTPSSVTVRMLGTRRYEVTGSFGPRTNPTSPNTVNVPAGEQCSPSQGSGGFTITDTRTRRDITTGETTSETLTTRYNPSPIVVCGG